MAYNNLHPGTLVRDLLVGSGIPALARLAADPELQTPTEPPAALSADEIAAIPLNGFATHSLILRVWSRVLDGEVYFVSGEAQVRALLVRGIPRGKIYTAAELLTLLNLPGINREKVEKIHKAKEVFDGVVRQEGP